MSANQAAKLAYQLILLIYSFLHLVDKDKEKTYTYHPIGRAVSETVKG